MVRTVRVELDLGGDAGEELEALGVKVTVLNEKVRETDDSLKKIPPDAAKAAASMKLLGESSSDVGNKFDESNTKSVTALDALKRKIAEAHTEVRRLGEEFNRTKDANVLEKMIGAQRDLKGLESLAKDVKGALTSGAADAGKSGAEAFQKSFTGAITGFFSTPVIGPITVGVVAAILAAVAVPLLAGLNGLLLSTAGLGGLALGIVGQFEQPAVHNAFATMGKDLETTLQDATKSFQGPLVQSAEIFGSALRNAIGSIDFSSLSKLVVPLANGIAGMIASIAPGLNKMFEAAGPILESFAKELPAIGQGISDMFSKFATGATGAREGLNFLVSLLLYVMAIVGNVVMIASKMFEGFIAAGDAVARFFDKAKLPPALRTVFDEMLKTFDALKNGFTGGTNAVTQYGHALTGVAANASLTATDIEGLIGKVNHLPATLSDAASAITGKLINSMLNLDHATLGVDESLTNLTETLKKNKNSLDKHSAAGQADREAILNVVSANLALYQAQIASGMSADEAAAAYDTNTNALHDQLRAAGLTEAQVNDLIGKYKEVPKKVNTDLAVLGLTDAINSLGELIAQVNGLDGRDFGFTVTQTDIVRRINQDMGHPRWGGIYQHAEIGLVNAGVYSPDGPARYAFAEPETGGEGFVPRLGNYQRSTAIIDQEARWYGGRFVPNGGMGTGVMMAGGGTVTHRFEFTGGGDPAGRALSTWFQYAVRTGQITVSSTQLHGGM